MPFSINLLQTQPVYVPNINDTTPSYAMTKTIHAGGSHHSYDYTERVTYNLTPYTANMLQVTGLNLALAGTAAYLPFSADKITSMRFPKTPGAGDARVIFTVNLDGCWMFIEDRNADYVLYHANKITGVSPTVQQSATQPLFQTQGAIQGLWGLYQGASADYPGGVVSVRPLRKDRYLRAVDARMRHKEAQGRTNVEHASKTTFVAFYVGNPGAGGAWQFWFQTFSQLYYRRPKAHIKSVFGHRNVQPNVLNDPYQIIEAARFL